MGNYKALFMACYADSSYMFYLFSEKPSGAFIRLVSVHIIIDSHNVNLSNAQWLERRSRD